jgi:hypothetical protein
VERSLFSVGVVATRIQADDDSFVLHPSLLEIVTRLQTEAGLLALVVQPNESSALTARTDEQEIKVETDDVMTAISAVHQMLHGAGFFIPSEQAGL